ncbi:MAG: GFA family protein, partial [Alphaproteobacteria bacterium]|nr:GFA family protein [Alphaproteobacteria bacterium]
PAFLAVCHCKNCQKQAGTAFSVVIAIPKSAMSIDGQLKTYHDRGDSGQPVLRNFCPECGSPITSDVDVMPDLTFIKAGTLDDTSWLKPTMEVYCDSVQPWITHAGNLQKFGKMPA